MKKLISVLALLVVLSTATFDGAKDISPANTPQDEAQDEYFENSLGLFTFDIRTLVGGYHPMIQNDSYGTAFIIEGKIVSAAHIFTMYGDLYDDIAVIGDSSVKGLMICDHKHQIGDVLRYLSRREGERIYTITNVGDNVFRAKGVRPLSGESGSPVYCDEHKKVVGLVTGSFTDASPWPGLVIFSILTPKHLGLPEKAISSQDKQPEEF